jgi:hypothetical protein
MATKTKRPKLITYLTPPGQAIFPFLNTPDRGEYAKNKTHGNWRVRLRMNLSDPEVQAFIKSLEDAYSNALTAAEAEETPKAKAMREAENKALGASRPFKTEFADDGTPTGFVLVGFGRSAGGVDKKDPTRSWNTPMPLFDSQNRALDPAKVRIGGGSTLIVSYSILPFNEGIGAGISLQLQGVQVLERCDAPTKDAAQLGFKTRDGGYVMPDDTGADGESVPMATTGDTSDDV